ncbi:RsmE family RNA methyltransferase [Candidatus Pelagibacter sp. HIMB109]|uniref:RsmE family RNA methyltransferase n=1 Tax=Candidatus Pelagibacter sp. HIMB109 TaxID=3415412 RepID=UPI003F8280F0
MTKIRLFFNESLEEKKTINIIDDDYHYLSNVMRCEVGSDIFLFNENNGEYLCRVIEINKKKLILEVVQKAEYEKIQNNINLIFCPPKSHKLDTLIQKCTEIGVKSFIPVISDHTENRKLNLNRIRKIIKEAVEQSNQLNIPDIFDPISFDKFLNQQKDKVFFADIQSGINFSKLKINLKENNSILIGPEGDFSSKELKTLRSNNNFISFSLGKRILRSETAAIASLVLFNNFFN